MICRCVCDWCKVPVQYADDIYYRLGKSKDEQFCSQQCLTEKIIAEEVRTR